MKTLYKRNTDGSIQECAIEVDGNKDRTISGRHNGALVTSEWTTVTGKNIGKANETTPEQQALSEAQSKYTKKLQSGYSEDINNSDTDLLKPQLAKEYKEHFHKMKFPYIQEALAPIVKTILEDLNSEHVKPLEYDMCHTQEELDDRYARYLKKVKNAR